MKATWRGQIIAESDSPLLIEGNWYFPPHALKKEYFKPGSKQTTCFWKGTASYYQINVDGVVNKDGAWYYPSPMPSAINKVGKDFTNYVGFWHGVEVKENVYAAS